MYQDYQDSYGNGDFNEDPGGYGAPTGVPDPNNPGYDTAGYPLPGGRTAPPVARVPSGPPLPGTNPQPNVPGAPPTSQTGGVAPPNLQSGALANFSEPAPAFPNEPAYTASQFTAPTIEQALNNPGLKFRMQMGRDSLQNWAAAHGTLNDTGTAKALEDYGQNVGEQGYGEVYARDFNDWQANEGAQQKAYGMNRQSQYIDPWTAAYNAWTQRGNWYLQNQGTVANTALGFASL